MRVILRNRFCLGELLDSEGGTLLAKHGALINPAPFVAVPTACEGNTRWAREMSTVRSPWALSGLAICGGCGASMNVTRHMTGKRRIRCTGRAQGSECREPSCYASVIEDQIGELLSAFAVPTTDQTRLLHLWRLFE